MIDKDSAKQGLSEFMDGKTFSYEKWEGKTFARLKFASTTEKGNIAEDFFKLMLENCGYEDVEVAEGRRGPYNVRLRSGNKNVYFGVALATQDTSGSFQFNGIRFDKDYSHIFCLGILPESIKFLIVPKALLNNRDYNLVGMEEGAVSFKLTRKVAQLRGFDEFEDEVRHLFDEGWD